MVVIAHENSLSLGALSKWSSLGVFVLERKYKEYFGRYVESEEELKKLSLMF